MDEKLYGRSCQAAGEDARENGASDVPKQGADWLSEKTYRGSAYDPRGIEQWLAERAAAGDELVNWNRFREGEPRRCKFYLEPAAKKGKPDAALCEKRALMGWEFVCTSKDDVFCVWRGDAAARTPSPRECTESYAYRAVCGKLRRSYFMSLVPLLIAAAICWWIASRSALPVHGLVTSGPETVLQGAALLSSFPFAALSDMRERGNLRALKRAMESGERVDAAGRDRWAKLGKIVSVVFLILTFVLGLYGRDASGGKGYDAPPLPYLSAEALGGNAADWYELCEQRTPLGGRVCSVYEPPYVTSVGRCLVYSTELDFYELKLTPLAAPLMHELRDYFMTEQFARPLTLKGFDEAYYFSEAPGSGRFYYEGGFLKKGYPPQYLLLRRGGQVLFYRAEAPESLLGHLGEFAEIFDQYGEEQ